MPGGNGMGPAGMGPMTGRGAGYCSGYGAPGFANAPRGGLGMGYGGGRGMGMGRGLGFGRGAGWGVGPMPGQGAYGGQWGAPAAMPQAAPWSDPWGARQISREEELGYLKNQAMALKNELDAISSRVNELENESGANE